MMKKLSVIILLLLFPSVVFAQAASGMDAIQMLTNLSNAYPNLWRMITGLCYIIGFALAIRGVYYLKMYGELRTMMATQTSLKVPVIYFIVAAVLMFVPSGFHVMSRTVFGYNSPLAYDQVGTSLDPIVLKAIVGLVQFIGLISFVRGWMILVAHAQQPGGHASLGKAFTHIIGGLLAINILGVGDIIWNTFGFKFSL